jgi:Mce-associated membrane protein
MTRADDAGAGQAPAGPAAPNPLLYVAIALVIIAAACAGWFGWSWYHSSHSASLAAARVRDQALQQGEQAVQNFNTLDYRTVGVGLDLWQQSSTGALLHEITMGRRQFEQEIRKARTVTTASILDGALTALNTRAGTAQIIVALQITVTPPTGAPTTKQSRLQGSLVETAGGWKLSALGQVPVGTAGAG